MAKVYGKSNANRGGRKTAPFFSFVPGLCPDRLRIPIVKSLETLYKTNQYILEGAHYDGATEYLGENASTLPLFPTTIDMVTAHKHYAEIVAKITGKKVFGVFSVPTIRMYRNGDILNRHVDKDVAEIALTVNIWADQVWPLYIEVASGDVREILMKPGDGAIYEGRAMHHWRKKYKGKICLQQFAFLGWSMESMYLSS